MSREAHLAPALAGLWGEVNRSNPRRDKASDGWIGDSRHSARASDHNPAWARGGVVDAIDTDKDGIDPMKLVQIAIKDVRTHYVIFNGFIWAREHGFVKRRYTGENKHTKHVHISLRHGKQYENSTTPWGYSSAAPKPAPKPAPVPHPTANVRIIKRGDSGLQVRDIQNLLNAKHYVVAVDGEFGPNLENAVRQFQRDHRLSADGVVGQDTLNALRR